MSNSLEERNINLVFRNESKQLSASKKRSKYLSKKYTSTNPIIWDHNYNHDKELQKEIPTYTFRQNADRWVIKFVSQYVTASEFCVLMSVMGKTVYNGKWADFYKLQEGMCGQYSKKIGDYVAYSVPQSKTTVKKALDGLTEKGILYRALGTTGICKQKSYIYGINFNWNLEAFFTKFISYVQLRDHELTRLDIQGDNGAIRTSIYTHVGTEFGTNNNYKQKAPNNKQETRSARSPAAANADGLGAGSAEPMGAPIAVYCYSESMFNKPKKPRNNPASPTSSANADLEPSAECFEASSEPPKAAFIERKKPRVIHIDESLGGKGLNQHEIVEQIKNRSVNHAEEKYQEALSKCKPTVKDFEYVWSEAMRKYQDQHSVTFGPKQRGQAKRILQEMPYEGYVANIDPASRPLMIVDYWIREWDRLRAVDFAWVNSPVLEISLLAVKLQTFLISWSYDRNRVVSSEDAGVLIYRQLKERGHTGQELQDLYLAELKRIDHQVTKVEHAKGELKDKERKLAIREAAIQRRESEVFESEIKKRHEAAVKRGETLTEDEVHEVVRSLSELPAFEDLPDSP